MSLAFFVSLKNPLYNSVLQYRYIHCPPDQEEEVIMENKTQGNTAIDHEETQNSKLQTQLEKEKIAREERKRKAFRNAASNMICDSFD